MDRKTYVLYDKNKDNSCLLALTEEQVDLIKLFFEDGFLDDSNLFFRLCNPEEIIKV